MGPTHARDPCPAATRGRWGGRRRQGDAAGSVPPPFGAARVKFAGRDNGTVRVVDVGGVSLRNACVGDGVPVLFYWEEGVSKPV